jgi:hypothetical protein
MYAANFDRKNLRGLNLLRGWLRELSIEFATSRTETADLEVVSKTGIRVQVQVQAADSPSPKDGVMVLKSADLTGRNISKALETFQGFVQSLGFEYRSPVSRGALPTKKLDYRDHFEDVALRHTELHRCPNPSDEDLKKYDRVIKDTVSRWYYMNFVFCDKNFLQQSDLITYAQMWTVTYVGMYQIDSTQGNNEGKLRTYLYQRLMEYKQVMKKKGRSIVVTTVDGRDLHASFNSQDEEIDTAYVERHNKLSLRNPRDRRDSAERLLEKKLSEMPHDDMIALLTDTVNNKHLHHEARSEALRRVNYHYQICSVCASRGIMSGGDGIAPPTEKDDSDDDFLGGDESEDASGLD